MVVRESVLPMYKDYFGLREEPFSIAPDPQFLYMSERHREALGHLIYGMKTNGGFVLLTGEVGTGKTTVCRCLLEQIPEESEIAYVVNPKLTVIELLETLCDELRIAYPAGNISNKLFIDAVNNFLLNAHSRGKKTVLIIDEAQNLSSDVLEQIRLLTNLETNKQKLLQVIMLGQPELKQMLELPELRQLSQRITARYHLEPLAQNEVESYVEHRLAVAGVERCLFPPATIHKLYQLSGGIPRLINLLCDRALLGAYVREKQEVNPNLLAEAAQEVYGKKVQRKNPGHLAWRFILPGLVCSVFLLLAINNWWMPQSIATPPVAAPPDEVKLERLEWNEQLPVTQSAALAYQALFELWSASYQPDQGRVFEQASRQGLSLRNKLGSLGLLRQLNRPAVLKLKSLEGVLFYATLTSLSDKTARLTVGKQQKTIPISALSAQWLGEFTLLWQAPPDYSRSLKPGDRGKLVHWLDQQMATLNGRSLNLAENFTYRGQLLEEVKQFQRQEGLEADGVVGTYTLIHLNSKISDQQPSLSDRNKG